MWASFNMPSSNVLSNTGTNACTACAATAPQKLNFRAPGQLLSSSLRVVEGQRGEAFQTFGIFYDLFSQMVIRAARNLDSLISIGNRLDSRSYPGSFS